MAEVNAAEGGRTVIHRVGIFIRDGRIALRPVAVVVKVHREGAEHAIHDQVADAYIFNHAAAPAPRFHADAAVRADKDAVGDDHILHPAAHLAADHHPAVTALKRAVGDGDIPAGA